MRPETERLMHAFRDAELFHTTQSCDIRAPVMAIAQAASACYGIKGNNVFANVVAVKQAVDDYITAKLLYEDVAWRRIKYAVLDLIFSLEGQPIPRFEP